MACRTHLNPEDKRLLERLRGQQWTMEELRWVLSHLDEPAPTLLVQTIHARLLDVQGVRNWAKVDAMREIRAQS
jgi:hypothetical protein